VKVWQQRFRRGKMYGERAALITVSKRALSSFHFVIHKINIKNKSLLFFFSFSLKTVNCVIIDLFFEKQLYIVGMVE